MSKNKLNQASGNRLITAMKMTIFTFIYEKRTELTFPYLIMGESWRASNTDEYFMYYLWTGRTCIFITAISFQNNIPVLPASLSHSIEFQYKSCYSWGNTQESGKMSQPEDKSNSDFKV